MTYTRTLILSVLAATLGFVLTLPAPSGTASASTPDGETPAEESVCDVVHAQNGGTPGLYGLCVAYCEAQDCDLDPITGMFPQSCENTSEKLLNKYNSRKGATDPDMPCILQGAECPCWAADVFDDLTPTQSSRRCEVRSGGAVAVWQGFDADDLRHLGQAIDYGPINGEDRRVCQYLEGNMFTFLEITPEEFDACVADTANFCGL